MMQLPENWRKVGRIERWRLNRNLRRQFGPGHELETAECQVIACHAGGDEFLLSAQGAAAPYYVVQVARQGDADDGPRIYPVMDLAQLDGPDAAGEFLEDTQIFLLDPEDETTAVAMEVWIRPVAPVSCTMILLQEGGSYDALPLIGDDVPLATGTSLAMAKAALAAAGFVMVDGQVDLSVESDGVAVRSGQTISFWIGGEGEDKAIWSVLTTPDEEFSLQRVDEDMADVLYFSTSDELQIALRNRKCEFIKGRINLL